MKLIKLFLGLLSILIILEYTVLSAKAQTATPQEDCTGGRLTVSGLTFSPDGKYILSSWNEGTARLWEVETGKVIHTFFHGSFYVNSAKFSSDGKYIVTGGRDRAAILWNAETGEKLGTFAHDKDELDGWGTTAYFLPDNKHILTSVASEVVLWDIETGKKIYTVPATIDRGEGVDVQLSSDGKFFLVVNWSDKSNPGWQLWDTLTGKRLHTFPGEDAKFSPDNKYVLSQTKDELILWNAITYEEIFNFGANYSEFLIKFSPDSRHLFVLMDSKKTLSGQVWDVSHLQKTLDISLLHQYHQVTFSPDSKYLVLIQGIPNENTFYMWDIKSSRQTEHHTIDSVLPIDLLASPDGKYLLIVDGDIALWDVHANKKIRSFC